MRPLQIETTLPVAEALAVEVAPAVEATPTPEEGA